MVGCISSAEEEPALRKAEGKVRGCLAEAGAMNWTGAGAWSLFEAVAGAVAVVEAEAVDEAMAVAASSKGKDWSTIVPVLKKAHRWHVETY